MSSNVIVQVLLVLALVNALLPLNVESYPNTPAAYFPPRYTDLRQEIRVFDMVREFTAEIFQIPKLKVYNVINPPGFFMTLGIACLLSDHNKSSENDPATKLKDPTGDQIRVYNLMLRSLKIKSRTLFYTPKVTTHANSTWIFQSTDTLQVTRQADLQRAAKEATWDGQTLPYDTPLVGHVLMNVMSFKYTWLHRYARRQDSAVFRDVYNRELDVNYVASTSFHVGYKRPGRYMAIKLPLKSHDSKVSDATLWDLEEHYKNGRGPQNAWYKEKQAGLAVYLIGKDTETTLEEYSPELLKEVHDGLRARREEKIHVEFPAFRLDGHFHTWLGAGENGYHSIGDHVTLQIRQVTMLCVDQNGIQSLNKNKDAPFTSLQNKFLFHSSFYFVLVHEDSGLPIVVSRVVKPMFGQNTCLRGN